MKITEITEGWGEYSNKSNHRMNKLKRNEEVDEGWGEFKSAAQRGAQAVGGAVGRGTKAVVGAAGRQMGDIKNTALAKVGSSQAAGKQQMKRVVGGVVNNFNRYVGQSGGKPTVGALKQYLTALGIQNPVMENRAAMLQKMKAYKDSPAKAKPVTPDVKNAKGFQGSDGRPDTDILSRNDVFAIIGKNIQQAMASGTLPKEIQKFLK